MACKETIFMLAQYNSKEGGVTGSVNAGSVLV